MSDSSAYCLYSIRISLYLSSGFVSASGTYYKLAKVMGHSQSLDLSARSAKVSPQAAQPQLKAVHSLRS